MTVPADTFLTFTAIGNREDLSDALYDISPTERPFMSSVDVVQASAVFHEWQTDSLAAAAGNRNIEGDDASTDATTPTTRLGNYCQISDKVVRISGSQQAVDAAGRANEMSYQLAKRGQELMRDCEYALTRNQASSAGGAGTARSLASVESWLSSHKTVAGGSASSGTATTPGFSSGTVAAPTDASAAGAFTEADLKTVIGSAWSAGGEPTMVMVGKFNKQAASAFGGIATQYRDNPQAAPGAIIAAADIYVSDFGTLSIVPNRFSRDQTALVLDPELWAIAELRPLATTPLAKTGDSDQMQILKEYTLVSRNQAGSGKVTDLTVA